MRPHKEEAQLSVLNRVNVDRLNETARAMRETPDKAKRTMGLEGEWLFSDADAPQFRAEVQAEKGKFVVEADQPTFLGGGGTRPGPMHYCLYGVAACTAATFVTVAATEGIELKKVKVRVESYMNFSKVLGIADTPIIDEVKLKITVVSDAGDEKIRELGMMAEERCPAVFCLTNPVKMSVEVAREGT